MSDDGRDKSPTGTEPQIDAKDVPGSDLPATFANRFTITVGEVTTRLAFGEAVAKGEASFHTAVVVPTAEARHMHNLLSKLLGILDQEIAKAKAKAAADAGRT